MPIAPADMPEWNRIEGYDRSADLELTDALALLANLIGVVLEYQGLQPAYSHSLPPEQVPLDQYSGPVAVHIGGAAPIPIEVQDSCTIRLQYTVRSYYFVAPIQAERAAAWEDVQAWLLPILRAQLDNQSLGGYVERCLPVQAEWVGEMDYGSTTYTGLIITSHLWINYDVPMA
jgi:hypothetical protein